MLADVLALTVNAEAGAGARPADPAAQPGDVAMDCALIGRVLEALGDGVTMAKLVAALRALGQIGAPEHFVPGRRTSPEATAPEATAARSAAARPGGGPGHLVARGARPA